MSKFLAVLMGVSLIPVLVMAYLSYRNSRLAIEGATINHLTAVNQLKKTEIETWIEGNKNTLEILARNPFFKIGFKDMVAHHDSGDESHCKLHLGLCNSYLCPVIQSGSYTELFILRISDGLILISTDPKQQGKFHENRPYFIEGMKGTYVQNVYYSMALQRPSMIISTPLVDVNGNTVAVLAGRANLEKLSKIMEQASGLSRTEDTYLVNTFNYFVTEPRFGKGYALLKATFTLGVTEALTKRSGTGFYLNYRSVPVIGVYTWIGERKLALITEIDQNEAFEPIGALRITILTLCLIVVAAVIIISWFTSKSMARPLEGLVRCTQLMGQGNLDIRFKATTRDEIGELAEAFGQMAEQLKHIMVSKTCLEHEIVERKKTEEKLNIVMKDLERSNRDLEQFAYVASHDLKEPLRMVWSYIELIREHYGDLLDENGKEYIHFAVDGATRMEKMISDLLSFSRVSTQGKDLKIVSSETAFELAVQNLQVAISESGAMITHDPLPLVKADDIQLVQVFQNLLANAIKFTREKPCIHAAAEKDGNVFKFSVKDNGIGIDSHYRKDVFKIFHRLHSREKYPGTGIGLALCRRIVERHGGHIWFESKPGEGSVFYFTLEGCNSESDVKGGLA
jgi:signal transduction histidine kinase